MCKIENLGAISAPPNQIMAVMRWTYDETVQNIRSQTFRELYERGRQISDYLIATKALELARAGDLKAIKTLQDLRVVNMEKTEELKRLAQKAKEGDA